MRAGVESIQRLIRARKSYTRYKTFYAVVKTGKPEDILQAAVDLVEPFGSMARESVALLIDDDRIDTAEKSNDLALLVGHKFRHSTSIDRLESLLLKRR